MDRICPSSTVYAAYHRCAGPAEIEVFPDNGHEGGAGYDLPRKLGALRGGAGPEERFGGVTGPARPSPRCARGPR
ncbi:acetylxylan esterase [Streptomyces griseus]|uniref:acetylxylan esterase n=1 Tax=Streptomyces griseus TaxID=1911 RepID=UPI0036D12809